MCIFKSMGTEVITILRIHDFYTLTYVPKGRTYPKQAFVIEYIPDHNVKQ